MRENSTQIKEIEKYKKEEGVTVKNLIIIGAGGHGKVIADIAVNVGYQKILFLDNNEAIYECMGYPVVGKIEDIQKYRGYEAIIAIGNAEIREKIYNKLLMEGMNIATLIHPTAVVSKDVSIGIGTVIMAGVIVNPGTSIGRGCIINTAATIDHDNILEDFVHVSVGAHLAGTVLVGRKTWVGAGTIVNNNISICSECMIGSGAVVVKDIVEAGIYVGMPARIKEMKI